MLDGGLGSCTGCIPEQELRTTLQKLVSALCLSVTQQRIRKLTQLPEPSGFASWPVRGSAANLHCVIRGDAALVVMPTLC